MSNYSTLKLIALFTFSLIGRIAKAQWNSNPTIADTKVVVASRLQWNQLMVSNGEGGAIIFWNDRRATNFDNKIYIDNLSSNGTLLWSVPNSYLGKPVCSAAGQQYVNDIIRDVNGNYFVAWEDFRVTTGDVYIQKINSSGQIQWDANGVAICTAIRGQGGVRLLSDGLGGVICTWRDLRNAAGSDSRYEAYAQRLDENGNIVWTANGFKINNNLSVPLDLVSDGAGGAIISLYDMRNNVYNPDDSTLNIDIYAQRISPTGSLLWGPGGIPVCTQTKNQFNDYHNMVSDGAGGAILYWRDYRNDPNNGGYQIGSADIYAQKINTNGIAQWLLDGVVISNAPENLSSLKVISDGQGGSVASWIQFSSPASTLNSQRTIASGSNLWSANGVIVNPNASTYDFSLDNIGGAIYTFADYSEAVSQIRAQRVQIETGTLLLSPGGIPVVTRNQSAREPTLVTSLQGESIVVWQDERNVNTTGIDLYAAKLSSFSVLPIRLIEINGTIKGVDALIQWEIATESNTFSFSLERSFNGTTFESVSLIQSTNNARKNFEILDRNVLEYETKTVFYRLKMVEDDGKSSYSKVIRLDKPKNKNKIKLENNPVKAVARLTYISNLNSVIELRIVDVNGKAHYMSKLNVLKGTNQAMINVSRLPEGTYLLQVIGPGSIDGVRFLKQNL